MIRKIASLVVVLAVTTAATAAPPLRFTPPLQPWSSADGRVALLRPATIRPDESDAPFGALTTGGWRLRWDGQPADEGRVVVRLALPAAPSDPNVGTVAEVLQVGVGTDPQTVRSCLTYGLAGPSAAIRPGRTINGVRFAVVANEDAGMSQRIAATDLRAVVDGRCYAVERFTYAVAKGVATNDATIPQAQAAALIDEALASLRIGAPGRVAAPSPPSVRMPRGAVAR